MVNNGNRYECTINSKIDGTPKGVYLPISKQHSIECSFEMGK